MANAARLEVDFPFGGKNYSIRPTFEIIGGVESSTGQSCLALANKCFASTADGKPSLTLVGQIIYALLTPQDKSLTPTRIGEILLDDGCVDLYIPLGDFLSRCLRGNKDHIRQAEEEARRAAAEGGAAPAGDPPMGDAQSSNG